MKKYIVSQEASVDIEGFRQYLIQVNGVKVADGFLESVYSKIHYLGEFPSLGRLRSEIGSKIHSFPDVKFNRTIFYLKQPYGVRIVRVLSDHQDHKKHMK